MRFSLGTLVLAVLWMGAASKLWFGREPWRLVEVTCEVPPDYVRGRYRAPDGRREVFAVTGDFSSPSLPASISDVSSNETLATLSFEWKRNRISSCRFLDDDTVLIYECTKDGCVVDNFSPVLFHRRFPEWWWGQFYRPEVWLFLALSVALFWRARKARGESRA